MNLQLAVHELAEKIFSTKNLSVSVGAGEDDAAVVSVGGRNLALTSDFRSARNFSTTHSGMRYGSAGVLSVRQNVSDIFAMGALPQFFLVSIMLTNDTTEDQVSALFKAIRSECELFGVTVVGGDTKQGEQFSICGTMIGEVRDQSWALRNARPGDELFVSGPLGDVTAAVLACELEELSSLKSEAKRIFDESTLPQDLIVKLLETGSNAACTDISDGLGYSLNRLAKKSNCVPQVWPSDIPVGSFAKCVAERLNLPKTAFAFGYGGDFQFLFSIAKENSDIANSSLVKIGRLVEDGEEIYLGAEENEDYLIGDRITDFGFLDFEGLSDAKRFIDHARTFQF